MKKTAAIVMILAVAAGLYAEKLAVFPDLMKPSQLVVGKDHIFVGEFPTVYIFSRADNSLVRQFGKEGEGPREFNRFFILRTVDDRLLVNSLGKVTFYTLEGEYIEEKRVNMQTGLNLLPLGKDRFVARGFTNEEGKAFITVNLLDREGKKLKELGRMPTGLQGDKIKVLEEQTAYETDGERIFLSIGKEFVIDIFNREGEKLTSITREYERAKFTEKDRNTVLEEIRTDPQQKQFFDIFKERAVFPDYWPAVASIFPSGDILYVMTFKREADTYEVFALNRDGTLISRKMIPFRFRTPLQPFPSNVVDGKLYQLIENDDEEWELHAWPL
ncbi:MAG: 6-bladed beta-propeller [Candidatus Aminicenantes bacterium]|nr:6-bladed beta-propeller [Candidatus Aminicenantes bacterium]